MSEITMPQVGKAENGTVVRWVKAQGDAVEKGDVLAEIETDRARVQVESGAGGILAKIVSPAGTTVPVGGVLGQLSGSPAGRGGGEEDVAAPATAEQESGGMVVPILMPQTGQTMEEGTVVKWRVQVGAAIKKGDIVMEVETDKSVVEVEAVDAGRLARIVVNEGDTVPVLTPVAFLAETDADVDAFVADQGRAAEVAETPTVADRPVAPAAAAPTMTDTGRIKASPAARKLARERRIDLSQIRGSGPGGRIVVADVPEKAPATAAAVTTGEVVRHPTTTMRKVIAKRLLLSKQTIPHFYVQMAIDAGPMLAFYRAEKAKYRCTVNDVVVVACARVLAEFPALRSRLDGDELVEYPQSNIGIAVGVEDGLLVPVVVGAEQMSLQNLAAASRRVVDAARQGKLEGMGKGVFTISNLGMFGVDSFSAIINPPESGILAVGTAREEVIVRDGTMRVGRVMTLTLSCDHRVVDGLVAARFLGRLKEMLESPEQLA